MFNKYHSNVLIAQKLNQYPCKHKKNSIYYTELHVLTYFGSSSGSQQAFKMY